MEREACVFQLEKNFKQGVSNKADTPDCSTQLHGDILNAPGTTCAGNKVKTTGKLDPIWEN